MSHKMPLGMRRQRQESSGRQYVRRNELNVTMAGFAGQMVQTFVAQQDLRRQVERIILDRRISGPFKGFWLPVYWARHYYREFEDWRAKLLRGPQKSTEQVPKDVVATVDPEQVEQPSLVPDPVSTDDYAFEGNDDD